MDLGELQKLDTLRLQNLHLIDRMHQGQQKCHDLLYGSQGSEGLLSHRQRPIMKPTHCGKSTLSSEDVEIKRYPSTSPSLGKRDLYTPTTNCSLTDYDDSCSASTSLSCDSSKDTPVESIFISSGTPKSILKRRKMIDSHVNVESKYEHTPIAKDRSRNQGLNFSYSDVDELDLDLALRKNSQRLNQGNTSVTGDSYNEESLNTNSADFESDDDIIKQRKITREKLLKDQGNYKKSKNIVTDFSQRSKSVVFGGEETRENATVQAHRSLLHKLPASLDSRVQPPLLGYDWIAGTLDSEGDTLYSMSEDYFDDIRNFRKQNKEDCLSNPYSSNPFGSTRPLSPVIQDPGHTCIHGYDVNKRLFTEPVSTDEEGKSVCPICLVSRKDRPDQTNPGFVRVSIPKSMIDEPYERKPSRRGSFDSADSCALTKHCLAGWECSQPSMLPMASSLDLQHASKGIKAKQTASKEEVEQLAKSFSRFSRLLVDENSAEKDSRSKLLEWELREAPIDPPYVKRR